MKNGIFFAEDAVFYLCALPGAHKKRTGFYAGPFL